MFEVKGRWNTATVYATSIDPESYAQVLRMCNLEALSGSRIRMMPDMHAAQGCTVGTSMTFSDRLNPAYVGGDIGCGMQVYKLRDKAVDFARLDEAVRALIPSGAAVHPRANPRIREVALSKLHCYDFLRHETVARSLGTLGGGNHFIEMERDLDGYLYLVIHSGSRRLGRDVALYHQAQAFFQHHGVGEEELKRKRLRISDIKSGVHPSECFLYGERLERYLSDMQIALSYADISRRYMGETIMAHMGLDATEAFSTVHNYVDAKSRILRKGAVSAEEGERLIIPINMRDGSLLCTGLGNPDWNMTAPHGAGRVLKRSDAKEQLSLADYRREMEGIFSTSVSESTLDESPMAYRRIDEILDAVSPTVRVENVLTPVYNFKASQRVIDDEVADGID